MNQPVVSQFKDHTQLAKLIHDNGGIYLGKADRSTPNPFAIIIAKDEAIQKLTNEDIFSASDIDGTKFITNIAFSKKAIFDKLQKITGLETLYIDDIDLYVNTDGSLKVTIKPSSGNAKVLMFSGFKLSTEVPTAIGTFTTPEKEETFRGITTSVAERQFELEHSLTSISLPHALIIHEAAFREGFGITSLFLPLATKIENFGFAHVKLTSLSLPKAVTIGSHAFRESPLTSLSLPSVTLIGIYAFSESHLTSLLLQSVKTIEDHAFDEAHLTSLSLPVAISVGEYSFQDSPLVSLNIPLLTSIGSRSFSSIVKPQSPE